MSVSLTKIGEDRAFLRELWQMKLAARISLGVIWLWEGLVPKLIVPTKGQLELVRRSGLFWPTPELTIQALGIVQVMAGLLLLVGWLERLGVAVASGALIILIILVAWNSRPAAIIDPYGGLAKDVCLFACAFTVWRLARIVPSKPNEVLRSVNGRHA